MKRIILLILIIIALVPIACNTNSASNDPRSVLTSFLDALRKKDIEGAKKYATKDSEGMLGMIQFGMTMAPDSIKDKMDNKMNMEYGTAVINGDKATVPAKDKNSGEVINYSLLKENGAWKVAFDLGTMMEIGKAKMKEHGVDINSSMDSASKMVNKMKGVVNEMKGMIKDSSR
jgi:hypothetical protein